MPCSKCYFLHEENRCPKCGGEEQYTVSTIPCPCGCGFAVGHCGPSKAMQDIYDHCEGKP